MTELDGRTALRSAENTVHDLIAIANDLRRHITDDLAARGYVDLRPSLAPLLTQLSHRGVPQARVADALGVSAQAASQTVGLAEQAGYVARRPNPDDRRSKLVVLTDFGRDFVGHGRDAIVERAAHYGACLGARRLARFDSALARLQAGLGLADAGRVVVSIEPGSSIIVVSLLADHAMHELRQAMTVAGHQAISSTQNYVLVHMDADGARSSELARAQSVSRQAVSATLHELEALGYVARRDDPDDGRGVVFALTTLGRRVGADYVAGIDALEQRYIGVLGAHRFAQFADTADELRQRLRIELSMRGATRGVPAPLDAASSRTPAELADLAGELWRWLGTADAVRLTGLLGALAVDAGRGGRGTDTRPSTHRGTA